MACYSLEPRTRKYVKEYGFLSFVINLSNKYGLLDTATEIGLDTLKTTSKEVTLQSSWSNRWIHRKQNRWQNCETKMYNWWKFMKCWRSSYSKREKRKTEWIRKTNTSELLLIKYVKITKLFMIKSHHQVCINFEISIYREQHPASLL